jgi:hypothetical protein
VLAFALVLGLGISGGVMTVPREAQCAACPTYTCFGPCGGDCACMKEGLDVGGTCVSFERADALERAGWLRVR